MNFIALLIENQWVDGEVLPSSYISVISSSIITVATPRILGSILGSVFNVAMGEIA